MAICPVCKVRWGCADPPVSLCPSHLTDINIANMRRGDYLANIVSALNRDAKGDAVKRLTAAADAM